VFRFHGERQARRFDMEASGKRRKLEGNAFALHGCNKVNDEGAVPARYKPATITLPAELWEDLIESLGLEFRDRILGAVTSPRLEVSATPVKADLKADIAGSRLRYTGARVRHFKAGTVVPARPRRQN